MYSSISIILLSFTIFNTKTNATYANGVMDVPAYNCTPLFADVNNYKELLLDSGYYTEEQLAD